MPQKKYGKEREILKITVVLEDILLKLYSETYSKNIVFKKSYILVLRSINGMLVAALILYKKFWKTWKILDLSSILTIHVLLTR